MHYARQASPISLSFLSLLYLLLLTLLRAAIAQMPVANPTPLGSLAQGSFERSALGTGSTVHADSPPSLALPLIDFSALAHHASAFIPPTLNALSSNQVVFLQGVPTAVVRRQFAVVTGRYRLSFQAAQHNDQGDNSQQLSIWLDGVEIAQFQPIGTAYATYVTHSFQVTAGLHTLSIVGLSPAGAPLVFIDDLKLEQLSSIAQRWSDPATWGGALPDADTDVTITKNRVVLLDTDAVVRGLTIDGELHCLDQDIALTAEKVMVHGRFECGSVASPFLHAMTLTLTGNVALPVNSGAMGDKVLGAMLGGVIELHGEPRVSWTQLALTADASASSITLAQSVDWREGDQIVIAPTREVLGEAEVVTITQVLSPTVVQFQPALKHTHWGEATTYTSGTNSWVLDERAEVGLLTRKFLIQGDASSDATGLGGHIMTMVGTTIHVSGVELYRMGQKGQLGRYPFHWHLLGNAPGQWLKNSSIHHSFNRCVTVHGTHDTLVADNVCYDFIGHGYFLEDGYELNNTFDRNLGIWAKKPLHCNPLLTCENQPTACEVVRDCQDLFDTDFRVDQASNGPAVFWIGHPSNTYTGNAAAGSEGTGFWYGMQEEVGEPSKSVFNVGHYNPRKAPFGVFRDNRVHSSRQGFSSCRDGGGPSGMEPPGIALIEHLTVFHTKQGVWPCSPPHDKETHEFRGLIVASSPNAMQAPNPMLFRDSVFVGYSPNENPLALPSGGSNNNPHGGALARHAVQVYDQGFLFDRVHFVNFDRPSLTIFSPGGGAHKLSKNRIQGATFDHAPHVFLDMSDSAQLGKGPAGWGDVIHDLDGSMLGSPLALVNNHPIMFDTQCVKPLDKVVAGYACPYRYGHFRSEHFSTIDPITVMRSDGVHNTSGHIEQRFITEIIINGPYHYLWRSTRGMRYKKVQYQMRDVSPGQTAVYEILDVPANYAIQTLGWSPATDLADLFTGAGKRHFYQGSSLFLKMVADVGQVPWHAVGRVDVCMDSSDCTTGVIPLPPPPSIAITPADGTRVASGDAVTINAVITNGSGGDYLGLQYTELYLGTTFIGEAHSPPYSWTVSGLPDGAYPVKVIVHMVDNRTFTELQQLIVGEPVPRLRITGPVVQRSYDLNALPSLSYEVFHWSGTGTSSNVRLIIDDQDKGVFHTSPIPLPSLSPGEHKIEVALMKADGTVTAASDRVRLYVSHTITRDATPVADCEDSVAPQGMLAPDVTGGTVIPPAFACAAPSSQRSVAWTARATSTAVSSSPLECLAPLSPTR